MLVKRSGYGLKNEGEAPYGFGGCAYRQNSHFNLLLYYPMIIDTYLCVLC